MPISFSNLTPSRNISYHNHSRHSDGAASPEDMVRAAIRAGFREFGLSDHFGVLPPAFPQNCREEYHEWAMDREDSLMRYVEEIRQLQQKYNSENFTLRLGIEMDFFPETAEETARLLKRYPFEYAIGSCHYAGNFPVDHLRDDWGKLQQKDIDKVWEDYWAKMRLLVASGLFQIAAHLDLPKKFGFHPSRDYTEKAREIIRFIRDRQMAMEINLAGLRKPCRESYPAPALVAYARQLGIPLLYSTDAHDTETIAFPENL